MSLARLLAEARRDGRRLPAMPAGLAPADVAEAHRIAEEMAAMLGPSAGWKLGATSAGAQAMLGLPAPFRAPILAGTVRESPARWHAREPVTCDAELVFVMGGPPDSTALADLCSACTAVRIGIEINAPRWDNPFELGGLAIVADCGANAGLVLGPALPQSVWTRLDQVEVTLEAGAERRRGRADAVLGDPWAALAALAAGLAESGQALAPGTVAASGNIVFAEAAPGSEIVARFGEWGEVRVTLAET